jgi:hypothetical protein
MVTGLDTELEAALKAMEASFHVRLISTVDPDLVWAPAEAEAARWLAENYLEFDQFPVKQGDATVGILLREGDHASKTIREVMQVLRDGLIVSADMPITDLILQLRDNHYRLVLRGGRIDGLVTQSDLLKLPVRMLLFGLISHLELCLRALIRVRVTGQEWIDLLQSKRRNEIKGKLDKLKKARFEPDPLELTYFGDVVKVLAHQRDLGAGFKTDMDALHNLRNDLAHAKTYISSATDVKQLANQFQNIQLWITKISEILKAAQ